MPEMKHIPADSLPPISGPPDPVERYAPGLEDTVVLPLCRECLRPHTGEGDFCGQHCEKVFRDRQTDSERRPFNGCCCPKCIVCKPKRGEP